MFNQHGHPIDVPLQLELNKIPFVVLDLGESLMTDIADYQISLLQLASSDMQYAMSSNFPFYTEQIEPIANNNNTRPPGTTGDGGEAANKELIVGTRKGRGYKKGLERPGFIHPSSEPLKISMEKQEQLKAEIRMLLKLALTNLKPQKATAESKQEDSRALENGLGYIGLILENAERKVAEYWAIYEGHTTPATVNYPEDYSLLGEEDRRKETEHLEKVKNDVPSKTFQKQCQKRIAKVTLGQKVSGPMLEKIYGEIDKAELLISDPDVILAAQLQGLVDDETASRGLGFPEGSAKKAIEDHTARLARIAIAQAKGGGAGAASETRGVPDSAATPGNLPKKDKEAGPARGKAK